MTEIKNIILMIMMNFINVYLYHNSIKKLFTFFTSFNVRIIPKKLTGHMRRVEISILNKINPATFWGRGRENFPTLSLGMRKRNFFAVAILCPSCPKIFGHRKRRNKIIAF